MLVRHGETAWNAAGRFQGQTDIPLNEIGRRQAVALGQRLKDESIDAIYASDLSRAWETATAIAGHHKLKIIADPRLREVNFGDWEGLTYIEIQQCDPQTLAEWQANIMEFSPPGGENLRQLADRVQAALERITHAHPGENILLVAHGGALQVLLCQALGISPKKYWQFHLAPGLLSEVAIYDEGAIINLLNDTCHLENTKREA